MNSVLAEKQTSEIGHQAINALSINGNVERPQFTPEQVERFDKCLGLYSTNKFIHNSWNVSVEASLQTATLQFPSYLSQPDMQILKSCVLSAFLEFASCSQAKRIISDACVIFDFLASQRLLIENTRTATVEIFVAYLENLSKNACQKNSIIRTFERLFYACVENGFTDSNRIIDFSYRFRQNTNSKRAPDKTVSDAVTKLLFDLSYPMPLALRCVLMILRLIPNRISEVLSMDIDCITYPSDGVFAIKIPTQKETDRHIPVVKTYPFQMSGPVEQIFYSVIKAQQKNATCENACPIDKNYLFFNREQKRVLNTIDVNSYLASLLEDNHICDSTGNPAKMTSHDFRHISIGERLRNNIISLELTRIEANHSNVEQTIAYGYQSVHDEAEHLKGVTNQVFDWSHKTPAIEADRTPQMIAPKKYDRLESQPYTRIIPCYGICTSQNCKPQFEQCVYCSKYNPNPEFIEYFQATKMLLEKKIASLEEKHGDQKAIEFNSRRLTAILRFIELIEKTGQRGKRGA